MTDRPIADYALLADCQGAALVDRTGSVDWLCLPRFDSPALFGRLLGGEAGHWSIRPTSAHDVARRYVEGTLVLDTTFRCDGGEVRLRDALAVGPDESPHELGARAPHALLREVECTAGEVELEVELAPRPEYGLIEPVLRHTDHGLVAHGGAAVCYLFGDLALEAAGPGTARGRARLRAGERRRVALLLRRPSEAAPEPWSADAVGERLERTVRTWQSWAEAHASYEGPWRELVLHSGRVLRGLTFQPTGAIVAAATTSLPEAPGGARNWDYRYTWVRDASLTLEALWVAACPDEAHDFFRFMATAGAAEVRGGRDMQILFGVEGEHDVSERTLRHLPGWRGSAPVRVGNEAWTQRQLDVYGELLGAAARLSEQLERLDPPTRAFLVDAAEIAASRWEEPDHGIWEQRGPPRDYLHSKLLCWVALDRAIGLADLLRAHERVPAWRATRARIGRAIRERGWSDQAGAYTQAFGGEDLDAAALLLPIVGFAPGDDARVRATIEAVEARLSDARGLVYRYRADDGLDGEEGTFLVCTFWLAHAWALAGEPGRARAVFEHAASYANDVGLLSEEVDARSGELLGNFPQAFSHIGLINAAWAIHEAEAAPDARRAA